MSVEKILSNWKNKVFKPIYWLEGEEEYYIDILINYAEHKILSESEADFNLTVFYGKDANWVDVVNSCKRHPVLTPTQIVILKEAQQMKDIEKLEGYIKNASLTTLFIVAYKTKTFDKRTKFYGTIKQCAEILISEKIKDYKVKDWIKDMVINKGFAITTKGIILLEEHIGNDLSRMSNEIEKLSINLNNRKEITEDDIEKYIGISKEYNVFELQDAIINKNLSKAITIIKYFDSNPKAAPIQLILPALYANFSKVYAVCGMKDRSETALKPHFYNNLAAVKNAQICLKNYGYNGIEKAILLLHHYNLKSIGIGDIGTSQASLLKEMIVKIFI